MRKRYRIRLRGCHDKTEVYMDLTPKEWQVIHDLHELVNAISYYQCMPSMDVDLMETMEAEETVERIRPEDEFDL